MVDAILSQTFPQVFHLKYCTLHGVQYTEYSSLDYRREWNIPVRIFI